MRNKGFFYSEGKKSNEKNYYTGILKIFLLTGISSAFMYAGLKYYKKIQMEKRQMWDDYYTEIEKFEKLRLERHLKWSETDPKNYSIEKYLEEVHEGEEIMKKSGVTRPRK